MIHRLAPFILGALVWPEAASAHLVSTRFGELYSGLLHPLTTLQHLVPWLALGLLGGLQTPTTGRWVLVAFPLAVVTGTAFAAVTPEVPLVTGLNVLSFLVFGLAAALAFRLSLTTFLAVVVLFGLSHGYANAAPGLDGSAWLLYLGGVGLAAYLAVTLVAGPAQALARGRRWGEIALRAAGSWVAATGAMYAGYLNFALP